MKNSFIILILFLTVSEIRGQEKTLVDTTAFQSLDEVVVTGFELNRKQQLSTGIVRVVNISVADNFSKTSLVNAFNTVAGVRMEERSPGSYRVNIRGSSVRSPFGVRNVKVYWNDIPITDPGGNTYFNQFAYNNWSTIQLFKGPAGSMYGAGTGGLVLLQTLDNPWKRGAGIEYVRGSYGLNNIFVTARTGIKDNRSLITYAHNETDGYRVQSAMRRDNFSWTSLFRISNRQELKANLLFTDMYYQTPGGLTRAEFNADPKAARPAAGILPGAVQAKAAIYQKNLLAGVQHRYKLDTHWSNATSLYVAYANIKNPAVRNYERRSEPHAGGRTVFSWENTTPSTVLKFTGGGELQHGFFNTKVFGNRQGVSDTLQTDDEIDYDVYSVFAQGDISINNKWFITAGTSLNNTRVSFTRMNKIPVTKQSKTYRQEWSPRISVLKSFSNYTSVLAIVSKGFSPPSIGELLPSTGNISTQLEAEKGWNYELGVRQSFRVGKNRIWTEVNAYYFRLDNTLVQRRDNSGADYFINSGNTNQKGIEVSASSIFFSSASGFMDYIDVRSAYSFSHFRYGSFTKDTIDLSGKTMPSVPEHTVSLVMQLKAKNGLYLQPSFYSASRIFLNDANTDEARAYHLLGLRLGVEKVIKKIRVNFYAGADNLLDEVYSLGNDINDPRGRYYNTAAPRNYFGGISFQFER